MNQDTKPAPEQKPAEPAQAEPAAPDAAAHTEASAVSVVAPVTPPAPVAAPNPFEPVVADEQPAKPEAAKAPEAKAEPVAPPVAPPPPAADPELLARLAKLEEAEKANAARLQAQTESARRMVLESLRVKPKYRHLAPQDADPFTDEGKRALEVWARENAELCEVVPQHTADPIVEIASKARSPHLVSVDAIRRSLGA